MKVYHLSFEKKDNITLTPRVPDNWMTNNGYEDKTTSRACVASTVQGALMAMSMNLKDKTIHVYSTNIHDSKIYKPSVSEVPDCKLTGELWVKENISLNYEKSIKIGDAKDKEFRYNFGGHSASLYKWNYKKNTTGNNMSKIASLNNTKQVKGFPSYNVTKEGVVATKDGKELKHFTDNYGYLCVSLRKDGKSYTKRVHRVVGETYLKPVKGKNIINHIDGNKKNPSIDNLEYMSNAENTQHGYDNNLYRSRSMLPIIVTDLDGKHVGDYRSIRCVSDELKVNRKTLTSILNEQRGNNYDYIFKYKEEDNMDKVAIYKEIMIKEAGFKKKKQEKGIKSSVLDADYYKVHNDNGFYEYNGANPERAEKARNAKAEFVDSKEWVEKEKTKRTKMKEGLIPSDYSSVKQIELDPSEYVTMSARDMKFREKIKDNADKIGAGAKRTAKNLKNMPKAGKIILGVGAGATAIAGAATGLEARALLKNTDKQKDSRADKKRDKDMNSRFWRDGYIPVKKRENAILPSRTALTLAAVIPTAKLVDKGGKLGSQIGHKLSGGNVKATVAGRLVGQVGAGYAASIPLRIHDAALVGHQEIKEYDRLKKRYFDKGITNKEKKDIMKENVRSYFALTNNKKYQDDSIEEKIQARRRRESKKQLNKKAYDVLDDMVKEASNKSKWSKEDKKGYAKNVALGVAQDFLNAGNPLNIGSSVVGSIADSVLVEKASLNMNKKLKQDQVSQKQVDGFNKTVGLKNGTTAINTAKALGKK